MSSKILVTGGAGFIGSNTVHSLASQGHRVIVVDDVGQHKWRNLQGVTVWNWFQPNRIDQALALNPDAVIHMGAITETTASDGNAVLESNFNLSNLLWDWCSKHQTPFVYASSASVYGTGENGWSDDHDATANLCPLNLYGWSKLLFDRRAIAESNQAQCPPTWVGLRFFNVYGPRESHKGEQASVIFKKWREIKSGIRPTLFKSTVSELADGEQSRDFVWVDDTVKVILWAMQAARSGIYNVGCGESASFNRAVSAVSQAMSSDLPVNYVPMSVDLSGHYQNYTCADISKLTQAGFCHTFLNMEQGAAEYVQWLERNS
jgi:ADP-L-glycero-D-manno-heptose 6-epimerase